MNYKLIMLPQPILVATVQNKITLKEAAPKILDLENQIKYFRICIKEMQFERTQEELSINEMYLNYRAKEKAAIKNIEDIRKNILLNEGETIAGIEGLPKLDLSLIAERVGWVDVEKLAYNLSREEVPILSNGTLSNSRCNLQEGIYQGVQIGFKAAQSLNEKKYSEEELKQALIMAKDTVREGGKDLAKYSVLDIIKSMKKPKEYQVSAFFDEKTNSYKVTKIV